MESGGCRLDLRFKHALANGVLYHRVSFIRAHLFAYSFCATTREQQFIGGAKTALTPTRAKHMMRVSADFRLYIVDVVTSGQNGTAQYSKTISYSHQLGRPPPRHQDATPGFSFAPGRCEMYKLPQVQGLEMIPSVCNL